MVERPIIFSAPMIKALLAGTKTKTRRVLKPPRPYALDDDISVEVATGSITPRFAIGDDLWVRESHQINAFGSHPNWIAEHIIYAADDACVELQPPIPFVGKCDIGLRGWRSPIHMPRWASRLTLTVTDVRVQRLQDISEADAMAEGCTAFGPHPGDPHDCVPIGGAVDAYETLWNSIHGPSAWEANPWVCAISFDRPSTTNQRKGEPYGEG